MQMLRVTHSASPTDEKWRRSVVWAKGCRALNEFSSLRTFNSYDRSKFIVSGRYYVMKSLKVINGMNNPRD